MFRELLSYIVGNPATTEPALDLILISRHLERIGDHATNIAEGVVYFSEGRVIKHHAVDDPNPSPIRQESGGPA